MSEQPNRPKLDVDQTRRFYGLSDQLEDDAAKVGINDLRDRDTSELYEMFSAGNSDEDIKTRAGEMFTEWNSGEVEGATDSHVQVTEAIVVKTDELEQREDVTEGRVAVLEGQLAEALGVLAEMQATQQELLRRLDALSAGQEAVAIASTAETADEGEEQPVDRVEEAETAPEQKKLADHQRRTVRQVTNGPIEKLVMYADGTSEYLPAAEANALFAAQQNPEAEGTDAPAATEVSADQTAAPAQSEATTETGEGQTAPASGEAASSEGAGEEGSAEAEPKQETDTDKARAIANDFNLDDPVQMGKYRAKLESEGILTAGLDAEALKRIANGEERFLTDAVEEEAKSEQDDTAL